VFNGLWSPSTIATLENLLGNHGHHGIQRPADALMNNRCGVDFVKIKKPIQIGPVFTRRRKPEILAAVTIAIGIVQAQAGGISDDIFRKGDGSEFCQSDIEFFLNAKSPQPGRCFYVKTGPLVV
jgi:hypothetical protein